MRIKKIEIEKEKRKIPKEILQETIFFFIVMGIALACFIFGIIKGII